MLPMLKAMQSLSKLARVDIPLYAILHDLYCCHYCLFIYNVCGPIKELWSPLVLDV